MTRDEAIEAGARALWDHLHNREGATDHPWDLISMPSQDVWRERATAVLDAAGWAEPAGYVVAMDDSDQPEQVFGAVWPTIGDLHPDPDQRGWIDPGERLWALVPVEAIPPGTRPSAEFLALEVPR